MTETKLDDATEKAMEDLIHRGLNHGNVSKLPLAECPMCQKALAALRDRVRELTDQARTEGFGKGSLMTGRGMLGFNLDGSHD